MDGRTGIYTGLLVLCLMIVVALTAVIVVRIAKRWNDGAGPTPQLPDFTVIDTGQTIHFVPNDDVVHHVDDVGRCQCRPRRTRNRRRSGRTVLYVDHMTHRQQQSPTPR